MDAGVTPGGSALVARAKAIILSPREEWPRIAAETQSSADIFVRYVLPLALIGPVAGFLGGQLFGYGSIINYRPPLAAGLVTAIVTFVLMLVGIAVLTLIADLLAPKFGGIANRTNALKLAAYGSTAYFLAGIFGLIPYLGVFGLLGLYSVYLYYTGASPLMKVPPDKAVAYTAVTMLCALLFSLVVAPVTAGVVGLFGMGAFAGASQAGGTITLPGGGEIDVDRAEQFGKQMEDAANGKSPPVEAAKLQALLPEEIGRYKRTATESLAMGPMGSTAEGTYEFNGRTYKLKIIDMSAMGAIAGMGAALGVEQSREDADGYERTISVDGRMQTESWNKNSNSGKFGLVVANRFMVEAEGAAFGIEELREAVTTIDPDTLEDLIE